MKTRIIQWLIVACSLLQVMSCRYFSYRKENVNGQYGVEYNDVRKSLGIPTIPKWWNTFQGDSVVSEYGTHAIIPPCHYRKIVIYESGQLEYEIDNYTAGEQYIDGALDRHRKDLRVYYFYVDPLTLIKNETDSLFRLKEYEMFRKGLNYTYDFGDGIENYKIITKEQADSIMKAWGISYND